MATQAERKAVKMVSDRKEKSRMVKFTATEADQTLMASIEQRLAEQSISFSDLCKQALQQFIQSPAQSVNGSAHGPTTQGSTNGAASDSTAAPPMTTLHQQILELQLQMARIEGKEEARQRYAIQQLEQQLCELGDRLDALERKEYLERQVRQLSDRLVRLEGPGTQVPKMMTPSVTAPDMIAPALESSESAVEIEEPIDPLLDRLAPLLEAF